ncbi:MULTISPECIES: HMA2 domain-containing protein [Methylosinus]|uniref:Uncharacterized protein n=1 Tax=Methylosinus trichosporium (strain ATCC 35070 / NCIMB 11131 / UNIQEM 75 / OB3b) TaxID=595536 RepID=A0A2D2D023_METT3|nr:MULTISPECIES: hypothetical protein [Methylosinus]ATQ68347.1 hypothetical protein CQW49_10985 [Methylosinus trichosporium OB3b]OBS50915.1 hypothetical protein A8B73_18675 [Methylosinus sp. 3S-1]
MVLQLHHVPGRLRVRLARLKGHARAIVPLHSELLAIAGVNSASINIHSGSVTIFYDRAAFATEALWSVLRRLGYIDAEPQSAAAPPRAAGAPGSAATEAIAEAVAGEVMKHVLGRSAGALIRMIA